MKLTFSDYLIGFLFTLPTFGLSCLGLSSITKLDFLITCAILSIIWIIDYSNHMKNTRTDLIINQMQNKIDELSKKI